MSALPTPALEFLPMSEADLDEVAAAERVIYPFPWTRGNFSDALSAGYSSWVMRSEGLLAGYSVMMIVLDEAHILNLSVSAGWQGRGLGRVLLDHLTQNARRNAARSVYLEVRPSNAAALALYRRAGFREVGRRRGYYPAVGQREDAIVMVARL